MFDRPACLAISLSTTLLTSAAVVALIGLGAPAESLAQSAPAKSAAAPAKAAPAPAKQASAAKKTPTPKQAKRAPKVVQPEEEAEVVVAAADDQQLLAAKEVYLGESGCEFNQKIKLDPNSSHPGYVDMSFNQKKYTMKPVMSPTGALRLEDVRKETLMIQIASKTMVMNQKTGQRLVDNCVHANQKTVSAEPTQVLMK